MKTKTSRSAGFTLVEIMIVVAIIGLLATIAIPNFVRARLKAQQSACINNLRQIDAAKEEWALENSKKVGTVVTEDDIKPYIKLNANGNLPKCPSGGTYTIGKVGEKPTCSTAGHFLP